MFKKLVLVFALVASLFAVGASRADYYAPAATYNTTPVYVVNSTSVGDGTYYIEGFAASGSAVVDDGSTVGGFVTPTPQEVSQYNSTGVVPVENAQILWVGDDDSAQITWSDGPGLYAD